MRRAAAAALLPLLAAAGGQREALVRKEGEHAADSLHTVYHHAGAEAGAAAGAGEGGEGAWRRLGRWLAASGAGAEAGLASRSLPRAGISVRSLLAGGGHVAKGAVLAEVPKQMWIHLDNYPMLERANLTKLPECAAMPERTISTLKLAAAVAVEAKKGDRSWFDAYLKQLPTLQEYHDTLPDFAGPAILADFEALPVIRLVKHMRKVDDQLRICFEAWQQAGLRLPGALGGDGPPEFPKLRWGDMALAMAHVRARGRSVGSGNATSRALVPGADFVNTAAVADVNVRGAVHDGSYRLAAKDEVPAGGELLEEYCGGCHNDHLMLLWGVFLDSNPVQLDTARSDLPPDFCMPISSSTPLRDVVLGTFELDRSAVPMAPDLIFQKLLSTGLHRASAALGCPPLAAKGPAAEQAPMRCALARLALEHCAEAWAAHDFSSEALPAAPKALLEDSEAARYGSLSLHEAAHAALGSGIGAVHPALLQRHDVEVPALLEGDPGSHHGHHGGHHEKHGHHHGSKHEHKGHHKHGGHAKHRHPDDS